MIIESEITQGSPEWFALKCGIPSAGSFDKIITTKGEPSKQREKYLYQLAGEKISGRRDDTYQNQNMLNGTEREATSRMIFSMLQECEVQEVGFVFYDARRDRGGFAGRVTCWQKRGLRDEKPAVFNPHWLFARREVAD